MTNIVFKEKIKNLYFIVIGFIPSIIFIFFSLNFLMKITRSVKSHYIKNYNDLFRGIRFKKKNILEIGIGGHDLEHYKGGSLLMWKHYFLFSNIYGLDIINKNFNFFPRINSFVGSQNSEETLNKILEKMKTVDVIIDDGSHYNQHIFFTFKFLFQHLSNDGIYIIEDIKMPFNDIVSDQPLESILEPELFFNTLIHRVNSSNFGEIPEDYFLNNIKKVICNDSQIVIFKNKRNKKKTSYNFSPEKTREGYIKLSDKINK